MNEAIPSTPADGPRYATGRYELRLLTPAFLGDADQNGRWRTPPIKALLRQWWRVVWAAEHGFPDDFQRMRQEEGVLFGHAGPDSGRDRAGKQVKGRKSAVRIRLEAPDSGSSAWTEGHQSGVAPLSTGLDTSYAWFGLIDSKTKKILRTGIKPDDAEGQRILHLACPEAETERIHSVLRLVRDFGQLGSRSRGGWGAVHVEGVESLGANELRRVARPLADGLTTDWPASFALDSDGMMIWQGRQAFDDWAKLMAFAAARRKEVRDALKTVRGGDLRAVLGSAKRGDRVANPLRWRPVLEADGRLRLRIFAMPWRVSVRIRSASFSDAQLASAWQTIGQTLDQRTDLERRTPS